ncbi:helix-turn-helix transcriptional regulator [Streptomyces sp. NPDC056656]|uniref:helix-turn-helix transcriptional regulator n=1 Tax=Streptomyces sp. NPDC056656 TaxID=3345895 RepID=UPI0036AA01E6
MGGTGNVEEASKAFGFSRAKGYDLVHQGQFPCCVLRIGRSTRVVTASLLRVLESGEPEFSSARA